MKKILLLVSFLIVIVFSINAQGSLQFNQVLTTSSSDGLVTVPEGKVWKIVSVNGGYGQIFSDTPVSAHCGTTCSGGVCSSSSCLFEAFIWELNGSTLSRVTACKVCSGGDCYNNIGACGTHTWTVEQLPVIQAPIWLKAENTLKVNMSGVYFSTIEFNIIP